MKPRRVLLAAGGTGGHFYPGYVLGRELRERGFEPLYLLREADPAAKVLEADGLAFVEVPMKGLPRRPTLELLRFFWKLARGLLLVGRVVEDFRPDAVIGFGGYLTFPAAFAAWRREVPVLLHESNSVLGLANRMSLPFARLVGLGIPFARPPKFPFVLSGTPVRRSLWAPPPPREARAALGLAPETATLLVFGGSQGARSMNQLVPRALKAAAERGAGPFQVLHLAGAKEAENVQAAYAGAPFKALVLPFLHEMERGLAAADLVVSRSGASTLAELAAVSRAALLIPYPYAAADHQQLNADAAVRAGAAVAMPEREMSLPALARVLADLIPSEPGGRVDSARRARLADMGRRWSRLGLPAPTETVASLARVVESLIQNR